MRLKHRAVAKRRNSASLSFADPLLIILSYDLLKHICMLSLIELVKVTEVISVLSFLTSVIIGSSNMHLVFRTYRGLTRDQIALQIRYRPSTLASYESGR